MFTRYVGLAEETVHGTPVVAVVTVDPESCGLDTPGDQALIWAGTSGLDKQVGLAPYMTEGPLVLPLDDLVSGYWWKWFLGKFTTTGGVVGGGGNSTLSVAAVAGVTAITVGSAINFTANDYVQVGTGDTAEVGKIQSIDAQVITLVNPLRFDHAIAEAVTEVQAPYTHVFSPSRHPLMTPFTVRVGKELFEHVFTGCVLNDIALALGESFFTTTLGILASKDSKANLAGNVTFGEGNIFAPHQVTATINAVDASVRVEGLSLKASNNADLKSGRTIGSRFPRRGFRGALEVTMEMTLAFIDTAELERFWGGATGPVETALTEFPLALNVGANLDITFPRVIYTAIGQPLEGRDRIQQKASIRALLDNSGDGPIIVSLTNNQYRY